ncbi:MAG: septum formation initiator family protein [Alphaproteobacteria bacterium]|nr:septum formation initiator family protein [Alphaproteobacteria bacterium]
MLIKNLFLPNLFFFYFTVMVYLVYHAFSGDFGVYSLMEMKKAEVSLREEYSQLREVRRGMEMRVALLRPENLDPDMLEERVRLNLNFVHPNDFVILRKKRK